MGASNLQVFILLVLGWAGFAVLGWTLREITWDIKKSTQKSAK